MEKLAEAINFIDSLKEAALDDVEEMEQLVKKEKKEEKIEEKIVPGIHKKVEEYEKKSSTLNEMASQVGGSLLGAGLGGGLNGEFKGTFGGSLIGSAIGNAPRALAQELGHRKHLPTIGFLGGLAGSYAGARIGNHLSKKKELNKEANIQFNSLKSGFKTFAKDHPKAVVNAGVGALIGGGSELVMPANGHSTNMSEIGKRALLGGALGGVSGELKARGNQYVSKLAAEEKVAALSSTAKGALVGGLGSAGLTYATDKYKEFRGERRQPGEFSPGGKAIVNGLLGAGGGALLGNQIGRMSPELKDQLKGFTINNRPKVHGDTLKQKIQSITSDPIARSAAKGAITGGGLSTANEFFNPAKDKNGKQLPMNKLNIALGTLGGGMLGATQGILPKMVKQTKDAKDFASYANSIKNNYHPDRKALASPWKSEAPKSPRKIPHKVVGQRLLSDVAKTANEKLNNLGRAFKNFGNTNKGALIGGGLGLGLGGLAYSGKSDKQKANMSTADKVRAIAAPAFSGALAGHFVGGDNARHRMHDFHKAKNDMNNIKSNMNDLRDLKEQMRYGKTASVLQSAGSFLAKNPRAGGAVLGAGAGLTANFLSGSDHSLGSAAVGAGLGALGGRKIVSMAASKSSPLLGKSVGTGVRNQIKATNAIKHTPPVPITAPSMQHAPDLSHLVSESGAKNVGPTIKPNGISPANNPSIPQKPPEIDFNQGHVQVGGPAKKPGVVNRLFGR